MRDDLDSFEDQPQSSAVSTWVGLAIVAGLFCLYLMIRPSSDRSMERGEHAAVGKRLSLLELEPLTGTQQRVTLDDLAGSIALINFWGTWCPPCRQEMPHIVTLQQEFGDRDGFRLLSISCASGPDSEDPDTLRLGTLAYLRHNQYDLPTYFDPGLKSRISLARDASMNGFGYPTTVLIDQEGIIRALWRGYRPGTEIGMHDMVKELVGP